MTSPGKAVQGGMREYLRILSARRWILVSVFVLTVLAVSVFVFLQVPFYRAQTLLLIEPAQVNLTEFKGVYDPTLQLGGELGRREFYETQYRLLVNRSLLEKTFTEFELAGEKEFAGKDEPIREFEKLFSVQPVRRSRLVTVSFEWKEPEKAARVLDYLVNEYIYDYRNRSLGVTSSGLDALREKARELGPKVEKRANELQEFVANTDMVSLEKTENVIIDRLKEISTSLSETERKRIEIESIYSNIEQALREDRAIEDMPEVALNPSIRDLKLEYIRTKQDFSELVKRFGPRHPEVVTAIARLKTIAEKLEQEVQSTRETAHEQLKRIRAQEDELRKELTGQEERVLRLNKMAARYNLLRDSYETNKKTYQALSKRIEEIEVTMAAGSRDDNIFVINEPRVPVKPVRPKKALAIALAAMAGLALGGTLCFVVDYFDTTIKGKEDVEGIVGAPVLGYVPAVKGLGRGPFGLKRKSGEILVLEDEHSAAAEAFRSIRTALLFSSPSGKLSSFQVTSSLPQEGKTLVSVNIASALAKAGNRVLLIDADLRKPRLHKVFGMSTELGLSNVLARQGAAGYRDVLQPVPSLPGLDCIFSGPTPPNPAELIGSENMQTLFDEASAAYDVVILDTPPVINVTDPVILSRFVQGTVLVVRSFSTQGDLARRSKELLDQARANVLGVVLNNLDMPRRGYYAYDNRYYYHQGYYYGEKGTKKFRPKGGRSKATRSA